MRAVAHACGRAATAGADGDGADHGGRGELGRELARHLVDRHGRAPPASDVPSGIGDAGSGELVAALQALGAQTVQVVLRRIGSGLGAIGLSGIPAERPMTGVFHLAGVLDDGIVSALTGERLERVLRRSWMVGFISRVDGGAGSGGVRAVLVGGGAGGAGQRTTRRRVCSWTRWRRSVDIVVSLG